MFKRDQKYISNEIKLMVFTDHAVRKQTTFLERKYKIRTPNSVWDSLVDAGNTNLNVIDVSKLPSVPSQLNKMSAELQGRFDLEIKESRKLFFIIDSINADKVCKIISKYGFPSHYLREWQNDSLKKGIVAVMTHINHRSAVGKKIKRLMLKEYKAGRVSEGEMKHYLWDVDGRRDASFGQNIDVDEWIKRNESE